MAVSDTIQNKPIMTAMIYAVVVPMLASLALSAWLVLPRAESASLSRHMAMVIRTATHL